MKTLFITLLLGLTLSAAAQNPLSAEAVQKMAGEVAPRFVSDPGSNTLSRAQLFREIDPSGYDLFNANLSFSDKDQVQKLGFSPLRLIRKFDDYPILSSLRLNMTNRSGALTTGISISYDHALNKKISDKAYNKLVQGIQQLPTISRRLPGESLAEFTERSARLGQTVDLEDIIEEYDLNRLRHVFKLSTGYNLQFFPVLRSRSENTSFDSLNYHGYKGRTISVSGSYSYRNGSVNLEASYNFMNKRKAADSTQTLNRYDGLSLGISKRLFSLIPLEELRTKDFYLKTRFVPSVYLGVAYEQSDFLGKNYLFAEEGVKKVSVVSPFLDIAISPAMQFRLTIPIKDTKQFDSKTKGETVNALFQVGYKLVNLN